jgi:putative ABC transport system ATP-binding protein
LIALREVHRVYRAGNVPVPAVRGVSLDIAAGEFVTIMGPSGSGKSTLLNIIGCLDCPTGGRYTLAGHDVQGMGDRELARIRNRLLGFIFQTFNLLPRITAAQNVELPLIYRGLGAQERHRRVESALRDVGLEARGSHRPPQLSGGEQQRVAIARALVGAPQVLLADEPTGNLDSTTGEEIMGIFRRLNHEQGLTIIQVSHSLVAAHHGKRIVHFRDGMVTGQESLSNAAPKLPGTIG